VRPEPGKGLALIDWAQQEFGIAAALSGDPAMLKAYASGDPYSDFAVLAGATNPTEARERYKTCALGVQNGMGRDALARQAGIPRAAASELLLQHRRTFPQFWTWSEQVEAQALLTGTLQTVFGWRVLVGRDANPRFVRNFPMQANGAEMLRLACYLATEASVSVCATLHDALLIEAPLSGLNAAIAKTEQAMGEASEVVLDGFRLRTAVRPVPYPETLGNPKDSTIWAFIDQVLGERVGRTPVHQRHASCSSMPARSISLSVPNKSTPYGSQ
jgi:DNA polymerase I-like protein with 3'-5' exonuclease and polymerase domains